MNYKDYIDFKKREWIGKKVKYDNKIYKVVDIDYNGYLMIDRATRFNDTTAVNEFDVIIQ